MTRETVKREIAGHEVEYLVDLTAEEFFSIQGVAKKEMVMRINATTGEQISEPIDLERTERLTRERIIEIAIKSIDGQNTDIVKKVLNLPYKQYKEIYAEAEKLLQGMDEEKKSESAPVLNGLQEAGH